MYVFSVQKLPSRSMSLRESNRTYILKNNHVDSNVDANSSLEISNNSSHPHVNILHYEYDMYVSIFQSNQAKLYIIYPLSS